MPVPAPGLYTRIYLAFLVPGTHFSTSTLIPGLPEILQGPTPEVGQYYLKNLREIEINSERYRRCKDNL